MTSTVVDVKNDVDESVIPSIQLQTTTKYSLVNHELSRHGMKRYQWLIWTICGLGFFANAMWIQAISLALANIQREFGFSDRDFGTLGATSGAGLAAGGLVWGVMIDVVGRRVAFLGTSLIAGVFGLCSGAQSSFTGLLVFLALIGIGIGGNLPIDATITAEYIPQDRFYLLAALSIFQPLGSVLTTLIAFWFMPNYSCSAELVSCHSTGGTRPCCSRDANMGWRYLFFTVGSITLGIFVLRFFIFPFYESPKYLLSKGNDKKAVEIVQKIAAFNKCPCELTMESLYEQCNETPATEGKGFSKRVLSEVSRLKLLFGNWRMMQVTISVWIAWMFDYAGISIAYSFLPLILLRKNNAIQVSLERTYVDYLTVYTPGVVGVILSVLMVRAPLLGRKWTLVCSSMITAVSLFVFTFVNSEASHVGLNMLENFCQTIFNATLFGWTPEAFPAAVRGTACGLAAFFGSLMAICGPLVASQLFATADGSNGVLYLSGGCLLVSTFALLCIPIGNMVASG